MADYQPFSIYNIPGQKGAYINPTINPGSTTYGPATPSIFGATDFQPTGTTQYRTPAGPPSPTNRLTQTATSAPPSGPSAEQQAAINYENQVRGDINSGYDAYFAQLDDILNTGLPGQQQAQEGIVNSQYNQGVADIGAQKTEGLFDLGRQRERTEANQAKTLRDLSGNIQNAFQAGNVFLGARGAGDSSAANQYAYGLTKLATQQRSDVQRQGADIFKEIDDREFKLNNIANAELNRLSSEKDQKILSVQNWFYEQQNALKQAKAQGQLSKSQDLASLSKSLLDQALQQINFVKQEEANQRAALNQWALNNATTINQARQNLQQVGSFNPTQPKLAGVDYTPRYDSRGNIATATGYGGGFGSNDEDNLFGNV